MFPRRAFLGACSAALLLARTARSQSVPTVRIGCNATDLYFQPYIAQDYGFFTRAGLTAPITPFANGAANAQAVIANATDVGPADMIQIANAYNRGIGLAFFAGSGYFETRAPTIQLCVGKASTYASPKDLEGGTIAVVAVKSLSEAIVREWLRKNGVDAGKIKLYELPYAEMSAALERSTVTAAFIGEPFLTAAKNDVRIIASPNDAVASTFYLSAWFGRRDWIEANLDTVRKLRAAFYETARWANTHHDETATTLAKYAKVDPALTHAMNRISYATSLDPKLMQPVLDIAVRYGLIERPVRAQDLIAEVS
jgi:ABC-type nitrate/sulfonate/bicarbonate transport system substrate-binding protein